jgi:hypothetical protein
MVRAIMPKHIKRVPIVEVIKVSFSAKASFQRDRNHDLTAPEFKTKLFSSF